MGISHDIVVSTVSNARSKFNDRRRQTQAENRENDRISASTMKFTFSVVIPTLDALVDRIVLPALWSEPVREPEEVFLADRLEFLGPEGGHCDQPSYVYLFRVKHKRLCLIRLGSLRCHGGFGSLVASVVHCRAPDVGRGQS
jgi:hypothetical protein